MAGGEMMRPQPLRLYHVLGVGSARFADRIDHRHDAVPAPQVGVGADADLVDDPGDVHPGPNWSGDIGCQRRVEVTGAEHPVGRIHRRGVHPDAHLPRPACGAGMSTRVSTSGSPYFSTTTAFMSPLRHLHSV